ncbi:hypothetical protein M9H77_24738 [Catharanthus roseus]|uniref:Uncharacterized protein n=1 Tax=Catharanthus roseus TaxID=4058 RepID=A0ACC0A4Y0_CATRO|nr:hypothetical protein M9H77_24738 [Catharanthus roseus]
MILKIKIFLISNNHSTFISFSSTHLKSRHRKENADGLMSNSDYVNEEYMEAIRTNSFVEMYSKVQRELGRKVSVDDKPSSSSSSLPRRVHLADIVEPSQEILTDILGGSDELHHFLTCFFQISSEACKICELILKTIDQTRANYSHIRRVTKYLQRSLSSDDQYNKIYGSLADFSSLSNPLSNINPAQFQELHDNLYLSLNMFTSKCRKIRRRRKFLQRFKKIAGGTVVAAYTALMITLIVLAIHSVVGIVTAPFFIAGSMFLVPKKTCKRKQVKKTVPLERLEAQLDTAAKGVYLLINDFDTMSRLVMRLNNEMEHSKFVADLCLKRRTNEMLKEIARELQINQTELMNQLEDLEEHVYLCILNINRSRRLLVEKMLAG